MRQGLRFAVATLCVLAVGSTPAAAALPVFDGAMSFPAITGPEDPEHYSWEVVLGVDQQLRLVDDRHAVAFNGGDEEHPAFTIVATDAHDARGEAVPTTIAVTDGNVITLTVHHRGGNRKANGAPFDYPIVAGRGWEGGFSTTIVEGPPPASTPTLHGQVEDQAVCLVPGLAGRTLAAARRRLKGAGCRLGAVRRQKPGFPVGMVRRQSERPGKTLPIGATVDVMLGAVPRRYRPSRGSSASISSAVPS